MLKPGFQYSVCKYSNSIVQYSGSSIGIDHKEDLILASKAIFYIFVKLYFVKIIKDNILALDMFVTQVLNIFW